VGEKRMRGRGVLGNLTKGGREYARLPVKEESKDRGKKGNWKLSYPRGKGDRKSRFKPILTRCGENGWQIWERRPP